MNFINLQTQYLKYKEEIDSEIASVLSSSSFIGGAKLNEFEAGSPIHSCTTRNRMLKWHKCFISCFKGFRYQTRR